MYSGYTEYSIVGQSPGITTARRVLLLLSIIIRMTMNGMDATCFGLRYITNVLLLYEIRSKIKSRYLFLNCVSAIIVIVVNGD